MMRQVYNNISINDNTVTHILLECDREILKEKMILLCNEVTNKYMWE